MNRVKLPHGYNGILTADNSVLTAENSSLKTRPTTGHHYCGHTSWSGSAEPYFGEAHWPALLSAGSHSGEAHWPASLAHSGEAHWPASLACSSPAALNSAVMVMQHKLPAHNAPLPFQRYCAFCAVRHVLQHGHFWVLSALTGPQLKS